MSGTLESWDQAEAYELWVGRWSRRVAIEFLEWLEPGAALAWADIGCGTGQLAESIIAYHDPGSVRSIDRAPAFVAHARRKVDDPRMRFAIADATALPWRAESFDFAVSGLVLNFVPEHEAMAREMVRVTKRGGIIGLYVWDYAGGMQMLRHFWEAAISVNPDDKRLDQAERFPICRPTPLAALFEHVGLNSVAVRSIDIPMEFRNFDDFWAPFLGRVGAAPTYLASLDQPTQDQIRDTLRDRVSPSGGPVALTGRAWAVKGVRTS
ncbi:MAG: class I SAM-dependent methyltransferase [Actinobacteria bacterium]|nr:class I SAM-dependent methyltransferase [Actinomycetota bacterium]